MKIGSRVCAQRLDKAGGEQKKGMQPRMIPAFWVLKSESCGCMLEGELLFTKMKTAMGMGRIDVCGKCMLRGEENEKISYS